MYRKNSGMETTMNVLVLNGSPKGENSITLQTVYYIKEHFPKCSFTVLHAGQKIRSLEKDFSEAASLLQAADLVIFCYPVYTFLVPSQLHRFIELIKENGINLSGKYVTQITTSKHFYDTTAHSFINENCGDLGMNVIRGLSADMEDLLHKKGQKEALSFFRFVQWNMHERNFRPENFLKEEGRKRRVVIVTDAPNERLSGMIEYFREIMPGETALVDLREAPLKGGCLGCFHCAADGTCIYTDRFDCFLRENVQNSDAIVYAFTIRDHSMGSRFKMYDDRQFCNGHRTVTMGKPVAYLVDGDFAAEYNLQTLLSGRAQVGQNFLAGISVYENGNKDIRKTAATLCYAMERSYQEPQNFYGVGGLKIFRDLIYQMQGLMREDHRFYKEHGFYDFPQKKKGTIIGMYLVGAMMNNPAIKKKIGNRMTEGMLMPYRKIR